MLGAPCASVFMMCARHQDTHWCYHCVSLAAAMHGWCCMLRSTYWTRHAGCYRSTAQWHVLSHDSGCAPSQGPARASWGMNPLP
jgi:hypothetical protein